MGGRMERIRREVGSGRAVSPVVGVMLMLVVAVVLAAVVNSFAGGLAGTQEKAPQASFAAEIRSMETTGSAPELVIKHLGGDPVPTKNVKLVTKWYNETTGKWEIAETTAPVFDASVSNCYIMNADTGTCSAWTNYTNLNTNYTVRYYWAAGGMWFNTTNKYNSPYFVVPGDMPADGSGKEEELWFGNYVMQKGDVIKSQYSLLPPNATIREDHGGDYSIIEAGPDQKPPIWNATYLEPGDVVTVELIDLTTNNKIFSKEVVVQ
ncbi:MAG: Archaeal flagellin [Candidatus Alkanophagales archaeon MCA70_species_2]|nr:Archaeal flagellin [Candidatus Alkanophaga liquidiphilum]